MLNIPSFSLIALYSSESSALSATMCLPMRRMTCLFDKLRLSIWRNLILPVPLYQSLSVGLLLVASNMFLNLCLESAPVISSGLGFGTQYLSGITLPLALE